MFSRKIGALKYGTCHERRRVKCSPIGVAASWRGGYLLVGRLDDEVALARMHELAHHHHTVRRALLYPALALALAASSKATAASLALTCAQWQCAT